MWVFSCSVLSWGQRNIQPLCVRGIFLQMDEEVPLKKNKQKQKHLYTFGHSLAFDFVLKRQCVWSGTIMNGHVFVGNVNKLFTGVDSGKQDLSNLYFLLYLLFVFDIVLPVNCVIVRI